MTERRDCAVGQYSVSPPLYSAAGFKQGIPLLKDASYTLRSSCGLKMAAISQAANTNNDHLIFSSDRKHPANLIPELCKKFWGLGWVTGTGGGASIRDEDLVYLAPSGVEKEMMKPEDIYVLEMSKQLNPKKRVYLRSPPSLKPSQCTPLFLAAFTKRNARCCIHTHSQWAVLLTLLLENAPFNNRLFEINNIEQIKAFGKGYQKQGNLGYHDTLRIPVIENTPFEEDLTDSLEEAMENYPDTYAVLVRRHGVYVWGDTVEKAKAQAESLDYLFQLAVEMRKLGLPWLSDIAEE